ncbi:Uncharacterised protein [Fusobacterium necrophorum subsp. necrophorum]|nr:Uncharacterised protein [Fusobacterium necrophorum subsp. necrophorum]
MDMITKFNGGVIMDVTNVEQAKIAEKPVQSLLWLWKESQPIFEQPEEFQE